MEGSSPALCKRSHQTNPPAPFGAKIPKLRGVERGRRVFSSLLPGLQRARGNPVPSKGERASSGSPRDAGQMARAKPSPRVQGHRQTWEASLGTFPPTALSALPERSKGDESGPESSFLRLLLLAIISLRGSLDKQPFPSSRHGELARGTIPPELLPPSSLPITRPKHQAAGDQQTKL